MVYSTANLMMNLQNSFLMHLKIEIHTFVPSTEPFLRNIRKPRHESFKNTIGLQMLARSQSQNNDIQGHNCKLNNKGYVK